MPRSLSCCLVLALILGAPAASLASETGRILLRSGEIDTGTALRFAESPDPTLRLVRFPGPLSTAQIEALERRSERVLTYLPPHSYLIRVDPADPDLHDGELTAMGAQWTGPYLASYKVSPEIVGVEGDSLRRRPVMVHLVPGADVAASRHAVETIVGRPAVGWRQRERFSRVRLLLSDAEIQASRAALAQRPEVFWIELEGRKVLHNQSSVWVGQSGLAGGQSTPVFDRGLLGDGQVVAVLDTGIDVDSCYFRDAFLPAMNVCGGTSVTPEHRKVLAVDFLWSSECSGGIGSTEWDTQGHGTHVAGTAAGDRTPFGAYDASDGMAPLAKLVVQDCGYQVNDCADCPGIGCPVVDLGPVFQQAYDQGARLHTNSWGDEENDPQRGEYTSGSEDADEFMWNHKDFLLFFAAGNSGPGSNTVDSPSTAKNVVSVGSTLPGAGADTISGFSSRGFTDDGRFKPDLTTPGSSIISARNDGSINTDNCTTLTLSGTSMATPGAAGLAALVREYYQEGFHPDGAASPAGFTPSAALIKATLINSGSQMANAGTLPNATQGWGRVLLDDALYFEGDARNLCLIDESMGFAPGAGPGDATSRPVMVASAAEPLEVTLAWTDFPSTPAASTNLVNDLDLVVSGPNGTFLGNVFAGGVSVTGGAADVLNNVEAVLVPTPGPGLWTVTVAPSAVPMGPQPYALVVTGALECQVLFADGFESGDTLAWSATSGSP